MLNINNLNRVRRVLSAQQGAKAPSAPDERLKYLGKFGSQYKYAYSDVDVEDWSTEDLSDLPPEKYYEEQGGDNTFGKLEYAEGIDPNNPEQQIYKKIGTSYDNGKTTWYGITQSGEKHSLSESAYNYLSQQIGIIDAICEEQNFELIKRR